MIRSKCGGRLGGRKLIKIGKILGIGGVGGGGQCPVSRRSTSVAAIGEIIALGGSVGVDEAPLAPVTLVGVSGGAVEVA